MRKRRWQPLVWLAAVLLLAAAYLNGNCFFTVTDYRVVHPQLPAAFEGLRIALVADLHNHPWGSRLTGAIARQQPDLIAVTGDLIDFLYTNTDTALAFVEEAVQIAPVYYVTGNHEARAQQKTPDLLPRLEAAGVHVLNDAWVTLERQGQSLRIAGVRDPAFRGDGTADAALGYVLKDAPFTVLLSHRPELFDRYVRYGAEVTLAGHAHGGQLRLPWVGALLAPHQGLKPKLTEGVHTEGEAAMVISRGLGNSVIPLRTFNLPELVMVTLSRTEE